MIEIIEKITQYYPQVGAYILYTAVIGWAFYKVFGAFKDLEHKIDLLGERMNSMATKADLQEVKDDLNQLKLKVGIIEEKVDVLWKRELRSEGR